LPAHAELTATFRSALASGALPPGVTARDPAEAGRRFAVYRNNVAHSLTRALATRFPVIERLLGAQFFAALAREFLTAHPPASPMLFRWGEAFPGFLQAFSAAGRLPYLPDVARLEWLRGEAYHAPDAPAAGPASLAEAAQDARRAGRGCTPRCGSCRRDYAARHHLAGQPARGRPPAELDAGTPESALILRDAADQVRVLPLRTGDPAFLQALMHGATLLAAAEAALRDQPGHDPGPLLLTLAQAGAITAFPYGKTLQ
jgi:hypothetical protein